MTKLNEQKRNGKGTGQIFLPICIGLAFMVLMVMTAGCTDNTPHAVTVAEFKASNLAMEKEMSGAIDRVANIYRDGSWNTNASAQEELDTLVHKIKNLAKKNAHDLSLMQLNSSDWQNNQKDMIAAYNQIANGDAIEGWKKVQGLNEIWSYTCNNGEC
jgi:hypothetical protein